MVVKLWVKNCAEIFLRLGMVVIFGKAIRKSQQQDWRF